MQVITHRTIHTNGVDLHVVMQGCGPLMIFCHGFPGHWTNWRHQMNAVADAGYTGWLLICEVMVKVHAQIWFLITVWINK